MLQCSPEAPTSKSATSKDWQKVGTRADLDQTGQLLLEKSPVVHILVVSSSQRENLIAVDPTCTHKGCIVKWKSESQKFTCPCHKAEFGVDGKVQKGSADKPLKAFTAKIEGDSVVVKSI